MTSNDQVEMRQELKNALRASQPEAPEEASDASSLVQGTWHHHDKEVDTATYRHRLDRQADMDPVVWGDRPLLPELILLTAIVVQAYRDATQRPRNDATRILHQEAWAFFVEPGRLEWFCEFLGWDASSLRAMVMATKRQAGTLKR